jgi:hypothetical protein
MNRSTLALALAALLSTTACSYNMAVRQGGDRTYPNTSLKATTLSAVQAITEANLAVESSTTPVPGVVVISARGTELRMFQIAAPTLNLTLSEVVASHVRVEASAMLSGQSADLGLTAEMVGKVFRSMDAKLAAGQP